jgi:hypothetical protein
VHLWDISQGIQVPSTAGFGRQCHGAGEEVRLDARGSPTPTPTPTPPRARADSSAACRAAGGGGGAAAAAAARGTDSRGFRAKRGGSLLRRLTCPL